MTNLVTRITRHCFIKKSPSKMGIQKRHFFFFFLKEENVRIWNECCKLYTRTFQSRQNSVSASERNLFTDNPKGDHSDSKWRKIIEGNGNHNWPKKDTDWRVLENRQIGIMLCMCEKEGEDEWTWFWYVETIKIMICIKGCSMRWYLHPKLVIVCPPKMKLLLT